MARVSALEHELAEEKLRVAQLNMSHRYLEGVVAQMDRRVGDQWAQQQKDMASLDEKAESAFRKLGRRVRGLEVGSGLPMGGGFILGPCVCAG